MTQRYGADDMLRDAPSELVQLPSDVLDDLVGRFTSCAVGGVKPEA